MIVTSNQPSSPWGQILGDDAVATAMIDRLIHHSEIPSLKGESYRLRDKDLDPQPALASSIGRRVQLDARPKAIVHQPERAPPINLSKQPGRGKHILHVNRQPRLARRERPTVAS
jgi:hypothetical protein